MDVFQIDTNISSNLVDTAVDSGSLNDDITEVCFDTHSEFNLNFFDTPDDSTNQGFSDPDSVESIASISSTPPPPPPLTPAAAPVQSPSNSNIISNGNLQNQYQLPQSSKLHHQLQLLQPPISVSGIKTGKRFFEHLSLASCSLFCCVFNGDGRIEFSFAINLLQNFWENILKFNLKIK